MSSTAVMAAPTPSSSSSSDVAPTVGVINLDPVRSGEQLFRSRFVFNDHDTLLKRLPRTFVELLGKRDPHLHRPLDVTTAHLNALLTSCERLRTGRVEQLRRHQEAMERFVRVHRSRLTVTNQRLDQLRTAVVRRTDRYLTEVTLKTFAVLEKEGEIQARKLKEEGRLMRRFDNQMKATFELRMFALHLQEETANGVTVQQLAHDNPQFQRCRRAALENIKPGFFHPTGRYQGLVVLNVFKIEHKMMLAKFQKHAAAFAPGKVKGLFTALPPGCVKRVMAFGMLSEEPTPVERGAVFRGTTVAATLLQGTDAGVPTVAPEFESKGELYRRGGFAQRAVDAATFPEFPRAFSRYSTLECHRRFVQAPPDREHLGPTREEQLARPQPFVPGNGFLGDTPDDGSNVDGDSPIRYLALCRVVVGDVHTLPKGCDGFAVADAPPDADDKRHDTVYNPSLEEYLVTDHRHVLPEFIVQFQFVRGAGGVVKADAIPPPTSPPPSRVLSTDLSTPKPDWSDAGLFDVEPGASQPTGMLAGLSIMPVLSEGGRVRPPTAGMGARRPSLGPAAMGVGGSGGAAADAPEVRENQMLWPDVKVNAQRQRDSLMDAVDRLTSGAWQHLGQWAKMEGAVVPPEGVGAAAARRAGLPTNSTVEELEEAVSAARQQLMEAQSRRLQLQHKHRKDGRSRRR